jgi:hypothetical protein
MPALTSRLMSSAGSRYLFSWCLAFCFAGLALAASAQPESSSQNPNPEGAVVIHPGTPDQPQPAVQPPPDAWDRFWTIEKVSDDEWTRHFRIGAILGLNIKANFKMTGPFDNSDTKAGIFSDGYVRSDGSGDRTGYWGYNDASQYDAVNQTLTMHAVSAYTPISGNNNEVNGKAFAGFELAYGGNLWNWGGTRIGWDFGFGLMPIKMTDNSSMTADSVESTYVFKTGDIIVPGAPYHGSLHGDGQPTIPFTPYSVTNQSGGTVSISGSHTLDVMLFTLRLGPTLYWDLDENIGLMVSGGPAVGIMTGSLKYEETIGASTTSVTGKVDGTDVVYGGYVNAVLTYHVEKNGDLFLGAQYMPLGSATISGGGREAQLNLRGQVYVTAGVNWTF